MCDFGIARDLESATDALMLTTVHEAAMTPAYAAPEQRPGAGKPHTCYVHTSHCAFSSVGAYVLALVHLMEFAHTLMALVMYSHVK